MVFFVADYTTNIDVWSAGCVFAELMLGQPIFPGDSGVDQLVEIIKVICKNLLKMVGFCITRRYLHVHKENALSILKTI